MTRAHLHLLARSGLGDKLVARLDRLEFAAAAADAFLIDVELHVALDDPDRVLVVAAWSSPEHYRRWEQEIGWKQILDEIDPLLAAEPEARVYRLVDSVR